MRYTKKRATPASSLRAFGTFLSRRGYVHEPLTNPFEILRVRGNEAYFVAYRNDKGQEKWPIALLDIFNEWENLT